jgi:maltose O-acetyltransferase
MKKFKVRLKKVIQRIIVNEISSSELISCRLRPHLWRLAGIKIKNPHTVTIQPRCYAYRFNLTIGDNTFINTGVFFQDDADIIIGNNCDIGMEVMFCTATHQISGPDRRAGETLSQPIVIKDGTWIGTRSVILPNVTIDSGCIIAAGSLVRSSCEANSLYAGAPAQKRKTLPG